MKGWPLLLTAGRFLVGAVGAVLLAVAELRAVDALGRAVGLALGAQELALQASRRGAVELVAVVRAVPVAVAVERLGNTRPRVAPELVHVTRREVCNTPKTQSNLLLGSINERTDSLFS